MPSFHNGAVEIAYLDEGEGDPIVLVHGFASSKNVNWVYPTSARSRLTPAAMANPQNSTTPRSIPFPPWLAM